MRRSTPLVRRNTAFDISASLDSLFTHI